MVGVDVSAASKSRGRPVNPSHRRGGRVCLHLMKGCINPSGEHSESPPRRPITNSTFSPYHDVAWISFRGGPRDDVAPKRPAVSAILSGSPPCSNLVQRKRKTTSAVDRWACYDPPGVSPPYLICTRRSRWCSRYWRQHLCSKSTFTPPGELPTVPRGFRAWASQRERLC